ncbi:MAG: glutamate-1-semialdehyde 2,1-aminomutase [Myxococcota bacterium]|nr:glutamate-1-semialdehyde 2,1-aminomutase [Myxococcota bacterium]
MMSSPGLRGASSAWFQRAVQRIPGGVNSPVRAWKAVGGSPPFIQRGEGCRVQDEDGRWYVDYVGSWGPLILGHQHPQVHEAIAAALSRGTSFGAATVAEVRFAELVCDRVPGMDMVRLVNSGTEATMSALRLARAATGRSLIVKFDGCYHGHSDGLLVAAGSGAETLGQPDSPGVPDEIAALTLSLPFNDLEACRQAFAANPERIAAVIVEPVAGNMGTVPPNPGFLEGLRDLCSSFGAVLVFDEVMTGFRVASGGAQERFGIQADLVCLGKIIGGGLPVGAYGGSEELMKQMAPSGPVYQAGTLSGNPLAVAAGQATLELIGDPSFYEELEIRSGRLQTGIEAAIAATGGGARVQRVGSMLAVYFREEPVENLEDARGCDIDRFGRVFQGLLARGIYVAPSAYEAAFLGIAHDDEAVDQTVSAWREVFAEAP